MTSPRSPKQETLIALGQIENYESHSIFAHCDDIDANEPFKILSSDLSIAQPASGRQMSFVSTSSSDSSTGIGIRELELVFFDSSWGKHTEIIVMNGTTEVNTISTDIYRIQTLHGYKRGSHDGSVGTITISNSPADATNYAIIQPYRCVFERCLYYVSPGKIAVVTGLVTSATSTSGTVFVLTITQKRNGDRISLGQAQVQNAYGTGTVLISNLPYVVDASNWTEGRTIAIAVKGVASDQDGTANIMLYEYTP